MTVVQATLSKPGTSTPWANERVTVALVGPGFVTGGQVLGHEFDLTDTDGFVSFDLTPTDTMTPAGCWYVWTGPDDVQWAFTVPTVGIDASPIDLVNCLISAPQNPGVINGGLTEAELAAALGTTLPLAGPLALIDDTASNMSHTFSSAYLSPLVAAKSALTCDLTAGTGADQAPLLAALFTSLGRGTYQLPPGIIPLDTLLDVPVSANPVGAGGALIDGSFGTKFLLRTASAGIRFGSPTGTQYRNGMAGNFAIDGQGIAQIGLITGHISEATFLPISIQKCTTAGLLLDATQNSRFMKLDIEFIGTQDPADPTHYPLAVATTTANTAAGVVFDHGASQNVIDKCELTVINGPYVRFTQSSDSTVSPAVPTGNVIKHPVAERFQPGVTDGVLHEAGFNNCIRDGGIYLNGSSDTFPTYGASVACTNVRMTHINSTTTGLPYQSDRLMLDHVTLQGNTSYSTASTVDASPSTSQTSTLLLRGASYLLGHVSAFSVGSNSYLQLLDDPQLVTVTTVNAGTNKASRTVAGGVALAADEASVNNSAALVTSGLSLTLLPNRLYEVVPMLFYDSDTTAKFKVGWGFPSGATGSWTIDGLNTGAAANATQAGIQREWHDIADTAFCGGVGVDPGDGSAIRAAEPRLIIRTGSTGGNLTVKYAQQVATATDTTLRKDSCLTARLLGYSS